MKNLLPRIAWDYVLGAIVAVSALVVVVVLVALSQVFLGSSEAGALLRRGSGSLGFITLLGILLMVTIYELVMQRRAQGKMLEPGTTESRVLSREVMVRAALSGAEAGVYIAVISVIFALLAHGAADLTLFWVLLLGLLPSIMIIAAGALAYAYLGSTTEEHYDKLGKRERLTFLALPLLLAVTFGFLFGAALGNAAGVVNALIAVLLSFALVRVLESLGWRVIRRTFEGMLQARGGPTIKVVSTHKA